MVRSIYYYAVMFITLVMMIGGGVAAAMNLTDVISPTPYYMSFEDFKNVPRGPDGEPDSRTEEELRASFERTQQDHIANERSLAMNGLLKNAAWIVIPLPIFIITRRKIGKVKE